MKKLLVAALVVVPIFAAADPELSVMQIKRDRDIRWMENPAAPGLKFAVM